MPLLLKLLLAQRHLLVNHLQAYAELMAADVGDTSTALLRRILVGGAGLLLLLVAAVLAGVALLLYAVTTAPQIQEPWALIVVPLVPLLASVGCLAWVWSQQPLRSLDQLRRQVRADLDMVRESSAP